MISHTYGNNLSIFIIIKWNQIHSHIKWCVKTTHIYIYIYIYI